MCQETYNIFFFQTSLSTTVYYTPNTSPRVKLYKHIDHARLHTVILVICVNTKMWTVTCCPSNGMWLRHHTLPNQTTREKYLLS